MIIHKRTRLTPIQRKEVWKDYYQKHRRICDLIRKYHISAPTIYKILHRGRNNDFTKRLPVIKGESLKNNREYLFVAIDDFSRELFCAILPDKTQYSAEKFLKQVLDECAYTIEQSYSDNGKEYRGNQDHAFTKLCRENRIE